MDRPWRIELLGGLRATQGERVVSRFRSHQAAGLLAYLAFYQHRAHAREALIEQFWPERDPESGRNSFRVALSSLRRQLEPPGVPAGAVLVADRASLQLNPAAVVTDVAQFEAALRAAERAGPTGEQANRLAEAVEVYRGELLPGHFEEWVFPERHRLAEAFLHALGQLTALAAQTGDLHRALQWARRAVSADPLREEAHGDLIRLLLATNQRDAAVHQYAELEQILERELGATPSSRIRELVQGVDRIHHGGTEWGPRSGGAGPRGRELLGAGEQSGRHPDPAARTPGADSLTDPLRSSSVSPCLRGETAAPTGTVTFLLAEVGSEVDRLRPLFLQHGGVEVTSSAEAEGRASVIVFQRASSALECAIACHRALAEGEATEIQRGEQPAVRLALHTGDIPPEAATYNGLALDRARQIISAGHGGQLLCSEATAGLLRSDLAEEARLVDLGVYRLRRLPAAGGWTAPERLFQIEHRGMPRREFPPLNAESGFTGSLPLQFTRFFGREAELAQLCEALGSRFPAPGDEGAPDAESREPGAGSPRLITLTGPGGSGKTRLAIETAARLRERAGRVVWFTPLAEVADARLILSKILDTLSPGTSPSPGGALPIQTHSSSRLAPSEPLDDVAAYLAAAGADLPGPLLVLDNFEHLVTDGAVVIGMLLERVPSLTLLITSRQCLGLPGEREFPVVPLPVPVGSGQWAVGSPEPAAGSLLPTAHCPLPTLLEFPSVRLFVDRAQAARPDFQVTPGNAAAVAALCHRLEGLPLALELAAARARMLTPAQMLSRLDQRFELLTTRLRDASPRQRSLRATLDWSHQLLTPELQRLFARLSVFRGGWTLEAAERICEDSLEALTALQESSLVIAQASGSEMRYRMLETLREYGEEQLSLEEMVALRNGHALYYLSLAEEAEPGVLGPDQRARLVQLEEEYENLRAALDWAVEGVGSGQWTVDSPARSNTSPTLPELPTAHCPLPTVVEIGLRLAGAMWWFWTARGNLSEGRERLARLLALSEDARRQAPDASVPVVRAFGWAEADPAFTGACGYPRSGCMASGDSNARAKAQLCAAVLAQLQCDHDAARSLYEACLARAREVGDGWAAALSLTGLGFLAQFQGDNPGARLLLEQSLPVWQAIEQPWGRALALNGLADVEVSEGDCDAALPLFEESLAIRRRLGDQWGIAVSVSGLGHLARQRGDGAAARAFYGESLTIRRELGDRWGIAECLEDVAALTLAAGPDAGTAVRLFGAAAALREAIGTPLRPANRADYERRVAAARAALGEVAFAEAWAGGSRLTWEQAVAAALAWLGGDS
jgi:predicted ATPase/DNA-binding SARP family transcriptional activator